MAEPVRHRQTKGAATDMFDLPPPRHISTLRNPVAAVRFGKGPFTEPTPAIRPSKTKGAPFYSNKWVLTPGGALKIHFAYC